MASKKSKGDHTVDNPGGLDVDGGAYPFQGSEVLDKSWFDLGSAEMMTLCTSCHMGGGPFEGIVQEGGTVIQYDDPSLVAAGTFDRDFYSYGGKTITEAFYGDPLNTIKGSVALSGAANPPASDWAATGVMEADCLMCHIDPDHTGRLMAADGVKVDPNRPRMMIFSERDAAGEVTSVSLGMPYANALANKVVRPYTDGLNRGSRPTPKNIMASGAFSVAQVGQMMTMMTAGLYDIENYVDASDPNTSGLGLTYTGTGPLPYALYADPTIAPNAWDGMNLDASYCANPLGVADEMTRLGNRGADITTLMTAMAGGFGFSLAEFNGYMFNDFIYGMQIKMGMPVTAAHPQGWQDGMALPVPFQLHAFEHGKFYSDADDFQSSVRDYVRNPLIENEQGKSLTTGILYSGRVGLAAAAMDWGMGLMMCGDSNYTPQPNGFPDTAGIVEGWQAEAVYTPVGTITPEYGDTDQASADARVTACSPPGAFMPDGVTPMTLGDMAGFTGMAGGMKNLFQGTLHDELPSFFDAMPTAELMGLDLNQNGAPMTYVQLIKDDAATATATVALSGTCEGQLVNTGWCAKTYYEYAELNSQHLNLHSDMFGGVADADSQKWTKVCGQCHIMLKDHDNSNVEMVRKYNLGMSADYVKNGHFVNMTSDPEAAGYDVHMSEGLLGCGSCHLIQANYHGKDDPNTDVEAMHNFLKGTDTAHMVRNDLDNNIRPKNCEQCHIEQIEAPGTSADPTAAHVAKFGEHTAIHMEKISCQACHIPYKKTWRFRAFDNTLGYYGNFDNGMGYDVLGMAQDHSDATMDLMAFPAEYRISPVYGASPGYGISHFNMVAQAVDADGAGQKPMDYVSEMVDYFHMTKDGNPGTMVNGMPTNQKFDSWKYFFQMFWNMKSGAGDGTPWTLDADATFATGSDVPDQKTFPPLYFANGTNGYPQIVTGNPITIMTWVDVTAGDANNNGTNDMANISYGGAKIVYLREMMAAISEYYPPTNLQTMMTMDWATVPTDGTMIVNNGLGKVVLKPTPSNPNGYVIYDHTGDMYPEIWSDSDRLAMQEALTIVINYERDPSLADDVAALAMPNGATPRIFITAHYFSDTHGVKPAAKALGADSCYDCHGDSTGTDVGAMRTTDRVLNFLPWKPLWYTEANFEAMNFIIDHEVAYLTPTDVGDGVIDPINSHDYVTEFGLHGGIQTDNNGAGFVGASQHDVLHYTEHLADHFFYQNHGEAVLGGAIYGVNWNRMTDEEKHRTYVPQVTNPRGNQSLATQDWIPENIREDVTAFGYAPVTQNIKIALNNGSHQEAEAKVFIYTLHVDPDGAGPEHGADINEANDGIIVKLSQASNSEFIGAAYKPLVVFQQAGAAFEDEWIEISDNHLDDALRRAQVVRFGDNNDNRYILRAGPGRYAAVHVLDMDAAAAVVDCDGGTAGIQVVDNCGTCDDDPYNDCSLACDGTWGGTDFVDECGNCITVASGLDRDPTCVADCSGIIGGGATTDDCGVCDTMPGNDNTTCTQDCNNTWNGDWVVDTHAAGSPCVAPGAVLVQDCDGAWVVPGTTNTFDACGVCAGSTDTCVADCSGEFPFVAGVAETGPLGENVPTHAVANSLYDSSRAFDDCSVCLSPNVSSACGAELAAWQSCSTGCTDEHNAYMACYAANDRTKNPLWNQSCERDCGGKWDGAAQVDSCGVCIDSDNPLDTRVPHATCSEDCDTELNYIDPDGLGTGDAAFDAWVWTGDYANVNYGTGAKNVNAAFDAAKALDSCLTCDTDTTNDCTQTFDGLIWQAGTAATVFADANGVITAPVLISDFYTQDPDEAAAFCAALDLGGSVAGTWRLPTNAELTALIGDSIESFTDVPYWTSDTAFANTHRSVNFATSESIHSYDTEALHVRCVQ